MFPLPVLMF
jgi:hypothetical protein